MRRRSYTYHKSKPCQILAIATLMLGLMPTLRCKAQVSVDIPADSIPIRDVTDTLTLDLDSIATAADSLIHRAIEGKRDRFVPDPIRSMWLAMVFPGGGQIYNRKYWKLPIVYGGFLGCAYALTWNNQMLHDYSQAYLDIMDSDPNTKSYEKMLPMGYDITGKEARFQEMFKNKKNYFRKYRDMSIFAFAGVYLLSVVDAYVDGELSTFDISEDLTLHVAPSVFRTPHANPLFNQNAFGFQCSLNF